MLASLRSAPSALLRGSKRHIKSALGPLVRGRGGPARALPPSTWGLEARPGEGLVLEGVPLHALLERHGSPLHVVMARALDRNVDDFLHVPQGLARGAEVYYSYKTNPVPGVLRQLHARGVGAEVISEHELWMALQLGVPADRIIYNGPVKSDASVRESVRRGLLLLNFNHREEVARVARIAREEGKRLRVGVRVVLPGGWGGQFGVPMGEEALATYREALAEPLFDVVGLHTHYGAPLRTAGQLDGLLGAMLGFCDRLHAQLGVQVQLLDFGGSLSIPTVTPLSERARRLNQLFQRPHVPPEPSATLPIRAYVDHLLRGVAAHFAANGRPAPRVALEPGRAMTGNTQLLLTRVTTLKATGGPTEYAILDAGMNLADDVKYSYHQLFPVNRYGEPATRHYTLAGPICTPADVLYDAAQLPPLVPGDSLAVMDAGAYLLPFATSFSFPQPAVVRVSPGGQVELLRRAETSEDLIGLDTRS